MPSPLTALRCQLLDLVERVGAAPPPTRRQQRALDQLVATRLDGGAADPYDLAARVAEVLAFVEDGVASGSYQAGALAWLAQRAAERLAELAAGFRADPGANG